MNKNLINSAISTILLITNTSVYAGEVNGLIDFTSGTPARASEVNGNFQATKTAVDDNYARITALENIVLNLQSDLAEANNTINVLQSQLTQINDSNVMALDPYLTVDTLSDVRGPMVSFSRVNVRVVNGAGLTNSANGTGNLIIGYDETDTSGRFRCTIGTNPSDETPVADLAGCTAAGGSWTNQGFKIGSHYIVVGSENNYSRWGGIVAGQQNTSNYDYAGVSGGVDNSATAYAASVTGGFYNSAISSLSSVSGGAYNIANGSSASVSGGRSNVANGHRASVSGGFNNTASGEEASISGGQSNTASGYYASVSGGAGNTASGDRGSVTGGLGNVASGVWSSVSGGNRCNVTGLYSWDVGGIAAGCSPSVGQ